MGISGEEWSLVVRRGRVKLRSAAAAASSSCKQEAAAASAFSASLPTLRSLRTLAPLLVSQLDEQPSSTSPKHLKSSHSKCSLRSSSSKKACIDGLLKGNVLEENCEEERKLVLKMEKAMEKVEHSEFFRKFGDQFQSLKLPETLNRPSAAKANANDSSLASEVTANDSGRRQSAYLEGDSTSRQNIDEIDMEIVVYGVGSILSSEVSRCQLSLALLLKKKFLFFANVVVFDPVLTTLDRKVITCLGCSMLMHNEEGGRTVKVPTVFYMPHCEVALYDNLLQANWVDHHLSSLAILGNSFGVYQERWSTSPNFQIPRPNYVLQSQKYVAEHTVDASSFPLQSAFNDMSWHLFPLKIVAC